MFEQKKKTNKRKRREEKSLKTQNKEENERQQISWENREIVEKRSARDEMTSDSIFRNERQK